jgi:hypothetical protein
METLALRPAAFSGNAQIGGISSYVYSKSWQQLLDYDARVGVWAKHFWVNISSDSKWENDAAMRKRILALPCARGEFVVVEDDRLPRRLPGKKLSEVQKDEMAKVRVAIVGDVLKRTYQGKRKWFVCHGKCAVCVDHGGGVFRHACGHEKYKGVVIGIGKH